MNVTPTKRKLGGLERATRGLFVHALVSRMLDDTLEQRLTQFACFRYRRTDDELELCEAVQAVRRTMSEEIALSHYVKQFKAPDGPCSVVCQTPTQTILSIEHLVCDGTQLARIISGDTGHEFEGLSVLPEMAFADELEGSFGAEVKQARLKLRYPLDDCTLLYYPVSVALKDWHWLNERAVLAMSAAIWALNGEVGHIGVGTCVNLRPFYPKKEPLLDFFGTVVVSAETRLDEPVLQTFERVRSSLRGELEKRAFID